MDNDNLKNIKLNEPIEPEIELDGGYAYCVRCFCELDKWQSPCPRCKQIQDWSWLEVLREENKNED